jgi:hypothetical protein
MTKNSVLLWLSIGVIVLFVAVHYGLRTGNLFSSIVTGSATAVAQKACTAKVVFAIHCYDEGNDAIMGLNGIRKINRG